MDSSSAWNSTSTVYTTATTYYQTAVFSAVERSSLIFWNLTVLVTSLFGDSIILIATINYNTIKQHKLIVALMQHMAVCDLLQTVFRVLPMTLAAIKYQWIMGSGYCHVEQNLWNYASYLTMFLTSGLSVVKFLITKYPLRSGTWSSRFGHKICGALWILSLVFYLPYLVLNILKILITHLPIDILSCVSTVAVPMHKTNLVVAVILYGYDSVICLSILIVSVASICILATARRVVARHGKRVRWEGIVTILLTIGVFIASYLPSVVRLVENRMTVMDLDTLEYLQFYRTVVSISYLNIMANFFVYALAIRSFRQFLILKTNQIFSSLRQVISKHQIFHRGNQQAAPQRLYAAVKQGSAA
jgi:hypothetical protein